MLNNMFKMMREVQPEQSTNNTDVKSQIEALGARMYVGVQDRTFGRTSLTPTRNNHTGMTQNVINNSIGTHLRDTNP